MKKSFVGSAKEDGFFPSGIQNLPECAGENMSSTEY